MAEAKFVLKEPKATDKTLVYLFYNFNYNRLKYSTGEKISPKFWNPANQRAKESKQNPEHTEFNSRLRKIENAVNNSYRKLLNDGIEITTEKLKEQLEIELEIREAKKKISLFNFIEKYIEDSKSFKAIGSVKIYRTTFNHLKNYSKVKQKRVDFDTIDLEFYNDYVIYLMKDINLSANTIGKNIKTLKTFLNEATERGLNTNLEFKKKKFKGFREDSDKIYLSQEDIQKLVDLDLSAKPYLDRTRDLFLIGCHTGLRFSDYSQIKKENILEENKLKISTQKTKETVVIPIGRVVKSILEKYDYILPKPISNQNTNQYLKEIGKLANLNSDIETGITKGGVRQKQVSEKYELISTHTARRSFATNLYLADVPAITIMKITGHKSEKVFLQYIRVTQEQNANKLLNHPFFK
ncbi:site-specific integrase [Mucilaginibacter gilvus]|uniref:Site-specific integrase n=1 Tax=Mucilaginibacter gilvus TaxID=2305909 RepID=A0A3S3UT75_9SPHI|nr:site-specific integrase [Mucilaginibacter gilvus]RWY53877.1 site-specific integrase [Mucilaginibacter gilvus]